MQVIFTIKNIIFINNIKEKIVLNKKNIFKFLLNKISIEKILK